MSKAEKTRAYIVEKTAPLFNAKGYAGTSMSDLEEATGLTKGAIYGNFQNKDEVALAAFDYNLKQVTSRINEMVAQRQTAPDQLLAFVDFYRDHFGKGQYRFGCAIANTATEADDTHPRLRSRVNAGIVSWKKALVRIMEEGKAAGTIRSNVQSEVYADLFISLIEGGIVVSKTMGDLNFLYRSLDQMQRMVTQELST